MEYGAGQVEEQTVQVRVQVIDMRSFTLDLRVPTYLPAQDLTQRIARDAGLTAHWDNGQRRLYWLRARGRLLNEKETLRELGVVDGELVYLLPEPPPGSGVLEQDPNYPVTHDYAAQGIATLVGTVVLVMGWAVAWGAALSMSRGLWVSILPAAGLGLLCCNFARHAWGGQGNRPRIALTALVLYFLVVALTLTTTMVVDRMVIGGELVFAPHPAIEQPPSLKEIFRDIAPGLIMGMTTVFIGWLAWWGAVENLPEKREQVEIEATEAVAVVPCGICGGGVTADVRHDCPYNCGRHFHLGCHRARTAVYRGDSRFCAVCNARIA